MTKPSYQRSVLRSCRSSTTAVATYHLQRGSKWGPSVGRAATVTRHGGESKRGSDGAHGSSIDSMRAPPITLQCECGAVASVPYGGRWTCASCGRTWDTAKIPAGDMQALVKRMRRYRILALGPPLLCAAVLVPLAVVFGLQFALLLFVLVVAYGLFVLPRLRERATRDVRESRRTWELTPE